MTTTCTDDHGAINHNGRLFPVNDARVLSKPLPDLAADIRDWIDAEHHKKEVTLSRL